MPREAEMPEIKAMVEDTIDASQAYSRTGICPLVLILVSFKRLVPISICAKKGEEFQGDGKMNILDSK